MLRRRVAGRPWGVRPLLFHVLPALAIITPGACIDSPPTDSPGFTVTVAPLTLPGVADACYDLAVYNVAAAALTPSARVWSREGVCADRFGDGASAISYVGACDASPSGRPHTVSLTLLGLCTQDGCDVGDDLDPRTLRSTSYQNPCPSSSPCHLERPCFEGADTPVEFNLTILRDAGQGFFDVAVAFEDIFCSAKLDCVPELLSRPGPDGARDLTAVLAFACTSGAADTCLYANTVTLDCGPSGSWTINPSLGPGNLEVLSPLLYRAAIYRGEEAFVAFKKSYWNVALGLDEDAFSANPDCTLRWQATASGGPLGGLGPYTTPPGTYPVVTWERDILVGGALNCGAHPINVTLSGEDTPSVTTDYTAIGTPALFSFSDCGDGGPEPIIGQCGLADGLSFESAPTDDLCASGQASAVSGTGPFAWSCSGQFGGDNDTCSADRSCDAATVAWSVGGAECEGGVDAAEHDVEQTAFDAATPTTGSRDYRCEQGVWVGLGDGTCVASGTETFEYTGSVVTFVVPSGVSSIEVEAFGAQGGEVLSAPGGRGAGVTATVPVVGGETLQIRVGGQGGGGSGVTAIAGYNGGGGSSRGLVGTNNSGAGGGGATEIRRSPFGLADRLLVAGGGGGAGGHSLSGQTIAERTGANAGQVGLDGAVRSCASGRPGGATQTAGGAGATASCPWANSGSGGSFGTGGSGAGTNSNQGSVGGGTQGTSGGGGGGGWYGGGGAAGNGIGNGGSAGGGGGSSYAVPGSSGVTFTTGARTGHGQLILTY